jgi:tetratricopeptide (TPR) repeat protein
MLGLARFSALLLALSAGPALAQEIAPPDAYEQGTRLASEGRWAEAADQFRAAIAARETAAARFNLAQAERNLGRLVSAKREFTRARKLAEEEGAAEVARLAGEALAALEQRIPRVRLRAPEGMTGVQARIDGTPVLLGRRLELDPGRHDLVVTAEGREPFVRAIDAREGADEEIRVIFSAPAPRPAPRSAPAALPAYDGAPVGAILLAGAGSAALVTATLLHLRRNQKLADAGAGCARSSSGFDCPAESRADAQHRELIAGADRAELARDVLLGVAAGSFTSAALWWLLDAGGERSGPVADVGKRGVELGVRGRF